MEVCRMEVCRMEVCRMLLVGLSRQRMRIRPQSTGLLHIKNAGDRAKLRPLEHERPHSARADYQISRFRYLVAVI